MPRKILYQNKVYELGDSARINGLNVILSETLVNSNPQYLKFMDDIKPLSKYEDMLLGNSVWVYLKEYKPRIYWLEILKLISEDLSPNWTPTSDKYFIMKDMGEPSVKVHMSVRYNMVYFKTKSYALQAINIMGKNIKHVL